MEWGKTTGQQCSNIIPVRSYLTRTHHTPIRFVLLLSVSNKSHLPKIFPHMKTVYVIQDPVTQRVFFLYLLGKRAIFGMRNQKKVKD